MITKAIRSTIFNLLSSHSLTLSSLTEEIFQINGQIGLWEIFQLSTLVLSREKCHDQSHWIRNFRFLSSHIGFLSLLGKFERHCLIRIFQCFSSHYGRNFRQTTLDWEWWRLRRLLINLTEWRERRVTCQQRISDIKHTWKNITFFHVCRYGFSRGWISFNDTAVLFDKLLLMR